MATPEPGAVLGVTRQEFSNAVGRIAALEQAHGELSAKLAALVPASPAAPAAPATEPKSLRGKWGK